MTMDPDIARLQKGNDDIIRRIDNLEETLYGNGHPGMKSTLELVAHDVKGIGAKLERMEFEAKEKQDKAADIGAKWKLLIAGAFASPIAAVIIERLTR